MDRNAGAIDSAKADLNVGIVSRDDKVVVSLFRRFCSGY